MGEKVIWSLKGSWRETPECKEEDLSMLQLNWQREREREGGRFTGVGGAGGWWNSERILWVERHPNNNHFLPPLMFYFLVD
jgi:hypothetical protein